ncbi:Cloroperoxidase [Mycena floridula]|nr:Cloroperoxidase [Mycena floridula]KAJ7586874.1 Cloroperoxidase [Mycena floridula]
MKASILSVALAIASAGAQDSAHQWIAPTSTDLRSPCPALNTLANHGFLPRDGRNLTPDIVLQASQDGFNVAPELLFLAGRQGLTTGTTLDTFTLDDIKLYNNIEHDASLSRGDFALGDNLHFNETIYQTLANSNPGVDFFNATSAGQVQKQRLADSQATNPKNINTSKEFGARTGQSALYLSIMGDPITGVAPKEFVNIFFREERMPIEEGWKRPNVSITRATISPITAIIGQASEWSPNPNQTPSLSLVVDAQGDVTTF